MTDQELLRLNAKGFIPGPGESETLFLQRVEAVQKTFAEHAPLPRSQWDWVKAHLRAVFDFEPDSIVAYYSNRQLTPWQGAACWIGEDRVPLLQLREGFRKGRFLGLYSREETLAHEAVHAARAAFDEPENEEFFAFAVAEIKWRKVLGPILKRPWEAWIFLATLLAGIFWEPGYLFSAIWAGAGFYRLARQHARLSTAFKSLMGRVKEQQKARAILFRLTDREIRQLAAGVWLEPDLSLRWRLLNLAYF